MRRVMTLTGAALAALVLTAGSVAAAGATDATVPDKPTFSRDVAPIFFDKCVSCHQPNDIAPMSLRSYQEARPWAKSIGKYVKSGEMPPWDADPGFGPFLNDRSLSQREIDTIVRWAKKGAPEGDPADLPAPPPLKEGGWRLGEPDYIITLDETEVAAVGADMFRNTIHETSFDEDRWITAIEVLPGNKEVVHHVILWQGEIGGNGNPDSFLGGWAAGSLPERTPKGTGRLLKKGAPLIGDMHYHPSGTAATDVTRIGLHFSDDVIKELVNHWIINVDFEIPAGDPYYEAHASYTFPQDSRILNLTPHMHYRGKDFVYTATYPDGRTEELLRVSDYDFNWQTTYNLAEPIAIPAGTRIDCVAHWDNSKGNEANPDYTRDVRFGNESFDEMMIGFVDYIVDEGVSPKPPPSPVLAKLTELSEQFPGEVWRLENPGPNGEVEYNAVHLPRQGDGGWYIAFANIVGKAHLSEIAWNGSDFTAKGTIPGQGVMQLVGSVDMEAGKISIEVTNPDGSSGGVVEGVLSE